jgi:hypothetical protein
VTATGGLSAFEKHEVDGFYPVGIRAYRLLAGFDKNSPLDVRLRYAKLICNNFKMLDNLNTIQHIVEKTNL